MHLPQRLCDSCAPWMRIRAQGPGGRCRDLPCTMWLLGAGEKRMAPDEGSFRWSNATGPGPAGIYACRCVPASSCIRIGAEPGGRRRLANKSCPCSKPSSSKELPGTPGRDNSWRIIQFSPEDICLPIGTASLLFESPSHNSRRRAFSRMS